MVNNHGGSESSEEGWSSSLAITGGSNLLSTYQVQDSWRIIPVSK